MIIYKVGGVVRDKLLGVDCKDTDWVVVDSTQKQMLDLGFRQVGLDFPVFLHPETNEEYALARTERKNGSGYNGFTTETNGITLEQDLSRRDLTINAMAMDEDGQIIDPYGGQEDIKNKVLRHVNDTSFVEDPVRLLRVARFYARYTDFTIHESTMNLLKKMVVNGETDHLSKERVYKELDRIDIFASSFFWVLQECGFLKKYFNSEFTKNEFNDFLFHDGITALILMTKLKKADTELIISRFGLDNESAFYLRAFYHSDFDQSFDQYFENHSAYLEFITRFRMIQDAKKGMRILDLWYNYLSIKYPPSDWSRVGAYRIKLARCIEKLKLVDNATIAASVQDKRYIKQALLKAQLDAIGEVI